MIAGMPPALNLAPALDALPSACRLRLYVMGWPSHGPALRNPDRALRRAIGAPMQVSLVDLELDPERFHGAYVATFGTVSWSRDTTSLGRLWLNPSLSLSGGSFSAPQPNALPPSFHARVTGLLLADAQVRAAHRARHHSPGGYGQYGLFIAELFASSIQVESQPTYAAPRRASTAPEPGLIRLRSSRPPGPPGSR